MKPMRCFVFAEIDLAKKCFRVFRVMADTEDEARQLLSGGTWTAVALAGCLGSGATTAKQKGCRTSLIRTREAWAELCKTFGLTAEAGEEKCLSLRDVKEYLGGLRMGEALPK